MTDAADAPSPESPATEAAEPAPAHDRASLLALLEGMGIETQTIEHPPVATVAEASAVDRGLPGARTKNLFLVVVPAEARVNLKGLHGAIGAQGRVSFGRPDQLWALLGVRPGSVTVFGAVNDGGGAVTVILDRAIAEAPVVCGHPLENTATTAIAQGDLRAFLRACDHEPMVADVPREEG